ncbi:MAG: AMP-dependent synthetase [Methylomonas sp.]|nr:AMP-dependent synthetase [Methylomonas sp.]
MKPLSLSDDKILLPELLAHEAQAGGVLLTLRVPENLTYFIGHFDQIPIVPGVVQIQWAVHYAREYLGVTGVFSHMEAVKFKELLLAGLPLQLDLRYHPQSFKLEFCYRSEAAEYSSGRIHFHDSRI